MHKIKKTQTEKPCDKCQFEADLSIILRRHKLSKHHHKCESCEFSTRTSSALKNHKRLEHEGGVLRTTAGFMITSDASSSIEIEPQDRGLNLQISKKKLTKSEYLKREKALNIEDKSRKDLMRSFKDVFKNLKKKIANLHKTHGAEPEYIIIVKKKHARLWRKKSISNWRSLHGLW